MIVRELMYRMSKTRGARRKRVDFGEEENGVSEFHKKDCKATTTERDGLASR